MTRHQITTASLFLFACGDNAAPIVEPDQQPVAATCDEAKLQDTLAALPHVTSVSETPCGDFVAGARCFDILFEQPIQHANPDGPHFQQLVQLAHRGCDRPTLVADWGYSSFGYFDVELSVQFATNTVWIEHRYQGESAPAPADWDWTALTIANGAADMHEVIGALRTHYGARLVTTGASKGGITAAYHKYLYPHDADGSIPYVAPGSRARIDPLYQTYLATKLEPASCATRLVDAQVAALTDRRAAMLSRLTSDGLEPAPLMLEYATMYSDWAFWQYYGVAYCAQVPTAATSNDSFYNFFLQISGLSPQLAPATNDEQQQYAALDYEWLTEQGFALQINPRVAPLLAEPTAQMTMEDTFRAGYPDVALPAFNGSVTADTRRWMNYQAKDVLLIYGQNDPWSGGALEAPRGDNTARFFVPGATHGAQISGLEPSDRDAAMALAGRMFGEQPSALKPAARRAGELAAARQIERELALRTLSLRVALARLR